MVNMDLDGWDVAAFLSCIISCSETLFYSAENFCSDKAGFMYYMAHLHNAVLQRKNASIL